MGVHELTTGLNGAGKTLVTVATKLRPIVGTHLEYESEAGEERRAEVRLAVGGIRDLMLDHDLIEVPKIDPERWSDEWGRVEREPGDAPVRFARLVADGDKGKRWEACDEAAPGAQSVVWTVTNWWLWCVPGHVIVIDECQRVFRPMASGKRVPMYIEKLETARHYGVRFIYITQHPSLIHTNVRQLVGPIDDISRVVGSSRTLIRTWDRIADYGKKQAAVTRYWKHDKSAFGLYKSAELHTKFGGKLPLAVWAVGFGLVALVVALWFVKGRLAERYANQSAQVEKSAPGGAAPAGGAAAPHGGAGPAGAGTSGVPAGRWPRYESVEVVQVARDPYSGRAFSYEGGISRGGVAVYALFGLYVDGVRVRSVRLDELVKGGYRWTEYGPCSGVLERGGLAREVTCAAPSRSVESVRGPSAGASAPVA